MRFAALLLLLTPSCVWVEHLRQNPCEAGCDSGDETDTASGATGPTTIAAPVYEAATGGCDVVPGMADASAPVILFSDLQRGPVTGGKDGLGVFITLYGLRFGPSGVVSIDGKEVAAYDDWNSRPSVARKLESITVQAGPANSGQNLDVVVHSAGKSSNAAKFSVTQSHIWFIDSAATTAGADGSIDKPFTSLAAIANAAAGDVVYIKGTHSAFTLDASTAPGLAIVGFPGMPPVLSSISGAGSDLVLANLILEENDTALNFSGSGLRFVGNTIRKITGTGVTVSASRVELLGNLFDATAGTAIEVTGNASDVDIAWNETRQCTTGIALVSTQASTRVFGNLSTETQYLDLSVEAAASGIAYFNNIAAASPLSWLLSAVQAPSGVSVALTNNTLLAVNWAITENSASNVGGLGLRNNAISLSSAVGTYIDQAPGGSNGFTAVGNNVYAPRAASGMSVVSTAESDARIFTNANDLLFARSSTVPATLDVTPLRLPTQSPLIDAGRDTGLCGDFYGVKRPQGAAFDVGAVETP